MIKYVERFKHEKFFVEDLKLDVALVSLTTWVRHKGLGEKFIMEWLPTLEEALKMARRCI